MFTTAVYFLGTTYRAMRRGFATRGKCEEAMTALGARVDDRESRRDREIRREYSTM